MGLVRQHAATPPIKTYRDIRAVPTIHANKKPTLAPATKHRPITNSRNKFNMMLFPTVSGHCACNSATNRGITKCSATCRRQSLRDSFHRKPLVRCRQTTFSWRNVFNLIVCLVVHHPKVIIVCHSLLGGHLQPGKSLSAPARPQGEPSTARDATPTAALPMLSERA